MKRTTWFNNHIEAVRTLPRYSATGWSEEITTRIMQPYSVNMASGIAIILDNRNNKGIW